MATANDGWRLNLVRGHLTTVFLADGQVRLMGDFDGWTRGVDLSEEGVTGDHVFTRFTATLLLPRVRPWG